MEGRNLGWVEREREGEKEGKTAGEIEEGERE